MAAAASETSAAASASTSSVSVALPESILRKVLLGLLSGLEYLHSLRIAHRDLKPDNVLLSSSGMVKLADLGVARQFAKEESEFISETHGTYHFFSPEMCSGDRYSAFVSDIWSLVS